MAVDGVFGVSWWWWVRVCAGGVCVRCRSNSYHLRSTILEKNEFHRILV